MLLVYGLIVYNWLKLNFLTTYQGGIVYKPFKSVQISKPDRRRKENKGNVHAIAIYPYSKPITQTPTFIQQKAQELNITHNQFNRCYWCCIPLDFNQVEIDHIVPKCVGGSDCNTNLRVVCLRCNRMKNRSLPMDFALYQLRAPFFIRVTRYGSNRVPVNLRQYMTGKRKTWLRMNGQKITP